MKANFFIGNAVKFSREEGIWVFGAVERRTRRCFLVEVPDRTTATVEPIIRRWILPGIHIISEGWAAYMRTLKTSQMESTHTVS